MYFAAQRTNCQSLYGWDVSQSSIDSTHQALATLGVTKKYQLELQNVLKPIAITEAFDCVTVSELLEHVDKPETVLDTIHAVTRPKGRIFINVPTNSPAPDHIYLWHSPEEVVELVRSRGFIIEDTQFAPTTGYSIESARKKKVTLNSMIIATRP
jgi:ubiquinone/menaquinone biosynthesis C-methylase UbiE